MSLMGCSYRTHINTYLGLMWVLYYLLAGTLYQQIVGIVRYCGHIIVDLVLFCYERDFLLSLSYENQANIIDTVTIQSRYLDDLSL